MFNKERFKATVLLKGEKMEDAAEVMGMSRSAIYRRMETGDFTGTEMKAFCLHYDVALDEIFFDGEVGLKWKGC